MNTEIKNSGGRAAANQEFKQALIDGIAGYAGQKKIAADNFVLGQLMSKIAACAKQKGHTQKVEMRKAASYLVALGAK